MCRYDAFLAFLFFVGFSALPSSDTQCNQRSYDEDSFVCVCNITDCDFPTDFTPPDVEEYVRIVTSRDEHRFDVFFDNFAPNATGTTTIIIDHINDEEQAILGFGGAFTDSAGINIRSLSPEMQDLLMSSYFAPEGIEYNLCRVPIAGSDFSTYPYSYDEVEGDVDLTNFNLTEEDFKYKIALIKVANSLATEELRIFGSPWSPPYWMKTNGMYNGSGTLLPEMWTPYANYLVKFIQEYEATGVNIWGLTPQNEPLTGFEDWAWNTCGWTAADMRDWIKTTFGPIMIMSGYDDVIIMGFDHNRDSVPEFPLTLLNDPDCAQYVDGTAVHWYSDDIFGPGGLDTLHTSHPDKFILYTEACEGFSGVPEDAVALGSWQRAERYALDIIEDLNHYSTGWVDWNLALDMTGGPNWANNFVDAPIIVNAEDDEFLKQPTFYVMGHFSKYLNRGATRIPIVINGGRDIYATAFHADNDQEVVIILNTGETTEDISILTHRGEYADFVMEAKSIETVIYQYPN